jgi:transposase
MPDAETLYRQGLISDAAMDRLRDTMTHQAEGENPAQPYVDATKRAAGIASEFIPGYGRGLQGVANRQGVDMPMPDWMRSNPLQRVLQNPDNQIAMGAAWSPAEVVTLRSLVAAGKSGKEIAAAFPDRRYPGISSKMDALGLRATESNEYVPPNALWADPAKTARIDELVKRGFSQRAIAEELGESRSAVARYLGRSDQVTAATEVAAENPAFWSNPERIDQLKAMVRQGMSQPAIARKLGTSNGNVFGKMQRLRNAGELPEYVPRGPSFFEAPERQAEFKRLVDEGWSQAEIGRKLGVGGGQVSKRISQFQERGELQDYVPQGGAGLTPAGRTPTLPQTRFMQGEAPESDPEITKALIEYLRSKGLHAEAAQLQFG